MVFNKEYFYQKSRSSQRLGSEALLVRLQKGQELSVGQQLSLIIRLSVPAMLAQISAIVMQYIDASMVGRLGANDSAAIGLVSTTTWLFGGICSAAAIGFTVQVAQRIGAGQSRMARDIMKQGIVTALGFSLLLMLVAVMMSSGLPRWLGGDMAIQGKASQYFLMYMLALPAFQMNGLAGGMLQSSGNMRLPSMLNILACILDVIFNLLFIFPTRVWTVLGAKIIIPGADFGVAGAALGTALAEAVAAVLMLLFLLWRSPILRIHKGEGFVYSAIYLKKALQIAAPVGFEQVVMCGAQIMATRIIAPLGTIAIAANSFAVTAESLCYMPGYGIAAAATALIGQSVGAGRKKLVRQFAWMVVGLGMVIMSCTAVLMYVGAPVMIGLLSPDPEIRRLGVAVLRIEAFAEPLYAASIVASGAFRGAGDTLMPSCMNFISMWAVRLPLAALLAKFMGLQGVWVAMCVELCVRGVLFLVRLARGRWLNGVL